VLFFFFCKLASLAMKYTRLFDSCNMKSMIIGDSALFIFVVALLVES
jgi:hypothetical protein